MIFYYLIWFQSRYVGYYEKVVREGGIVPSGEPLIISRIILKGMHKVGAGDGSEFTIAIQSKSQSIPFIAHVASRKNCRVCFMFILLSRYFYWIN